jgi:NitT/TauT family transport system ATP-binding protein
VPDAGVLLEGIGKRFVRPGRDDGYEALRDLSLRVEAGEFLCILGPTGCGKSTVLHLVAGFEAPTAGTILVNGRHVVGPGPDRGVVFQSELALFPWLTVAENVGFGPRVQGLPRKERQGVIDHHLHLVGLAPHRHKFPRELSGGMKQRVQIARVLANDPSVLLMDEPFGALDAQTRAHLQRRTSTIWAETGKTVVFVTHDITEALVLADRIAVMSPGPASAIKQVVPIDLPRPRERMTREFAELYNELHDEIEASISARDTDGE